MTNSSSSSNNAAMQQSSNENSQKGSGLPSTLTGNSFGPSQTTTAELDRAKREWLNTQINPPVIYPGTIQAGFGPKRRAATDITINEVENGRLVTVNGKTYICPQGTPLLEIIGQALVEAQLEK